MNNGKEFYEKNEVIMVVDASGKTAWYKKPSKPGDSEFTGNFHEATRYAKTGSTMAANRLFPRFLMVQQFEYNGYTLKPIMRDDKNR